MKKLLIAIALISPTLASADDDIEKALRQIDAEDARIFQIEFEDAKRLCDEHHVCGNYRLMLVEARRRLLEQRKKGDK